MRSSASLPSTPLCTQGTSQGQNFLAVIFENGGAESHEVSQSLMCFQAQQQKSIKTVLHEGFYVMKYHHPNTLSSIL